MLYHTGYRLIDKDDLLLLSTAVYISSHGIVFLSRSYLPAYLSNGKATRVYIYMCMYLYMCIIYIYVYVHTSKNESRKRISMGYRALLSFKSSARALFTGVCALATIVHHCNWW